LRTQAEVSRATPRYFRIIAPAMCASAVWLVAFLTTPQHTRETGWRGSIIGSAFANPAESVSPKVAPDNRSPANLRGLPPTSEVRTPASANTNFTSVEQKAVSDKLRQIRLREFGPIDNLPLSEVIRSLSEEARRIDSEKKGVNFFLSSQAARSPDNEPNDVNGVSIRVGMLLRDITLEQALRIIVEAAGRPIQFSVEDYGVLVTQVLTAKEPVLTRMFKVDASSFLQNLEAIQNPNANRRSPRAAATKDLVGAVTGYLKKAGVDLTAPGRNIFFNDRVGTLAVRATLEELDTVEKMIQMANTNPQQLTLRVKVMEVSLTNSNAAWDWFVGGPLATNAWSGKNPPNPPTVTGILTDEQFRAAIRNLENRGGTDLVSAPEVTTMSGRQAQIKVVDIRYIVTDLDYDTNSPTAKLATNVVTGGATKSGRGVPRPIAEPFEIGPIVDVVPHVMPDGYSIQLWVQPSLREFLGYDDPGAFVVKGQPGVEETPMPLPKFRLRQAAASAVVWDGQTLVICAGTARHVEKQREADGTMTNRSTDKVLFFFVTPRLIDPAGNALHSNEELFGVHKNLPDQQRFVAPRR
jgi:hypothetical protein